MFKKCLSLLLLVQLLIATNAELVRYVSPLIFSELFRTTNILDRSHKRQIIDLSRTYI